MRSDGGGDGGGFDGGVGGGGVGGGGVACPKTELKTIPITQNEKMATLGPHHDLIEEVTANASRHAGPRARFSERLKFTATSTSGSDARPSASWPATRHTPHTDRRLSDDVLMGGELCRWPSCQPLETDRD